MLKVGSLYKRKKGFRSFLVTGTNEIEYLNEGDIVLILELVEKVGRYVFRWKVLTTNGIVGYYRTDSSYSDFETRGWELLESSNEED